jgi:solute:Na+ symporter, SSS family
MVLVEDFYRAARPRSTDRQRLRAARVIVIVVGLLNVITALMLARTEGSALSMWFAVSAIASGGLAGLFFLAFLTPRASRAGAWTGIAASTAFTVWAVLTKGAKPLVDLSPVNYAGDDLTIGAVGNIVLFTVGLLTSLLIAPAKIADRTGTVWHWRELRNARRHAEVAP